MPGSGSYNLKRMPSSQFLPEEQRIWPHDQHPKFKTFTWRMDLPKTATSESQRVFNLWYPQNYTKKETVVNVRALTVSVPQGSAQRKQAKFTHHPVFPWKQIYLHTLKQPSKSKLLSKVVLQNWINDKKEFSRQTYAVGIHYN